MPDIALQFDEDARRFDIAVAGRDLVLDATPATSMILALGCERRARADDALPGAPAPEGFGDRRGWCGDALDRADRRLGARLWLLVRAKQSEETRLRAERYAAEALERLAGELRLDVAVAAEWARRGVLRLTCRAGRSQVVVLQGIG